jgi:dihydropteroate synthase
LINALKQPGNPPWHGSQEPVVMGILNCTPDSFSDGGELPHVDDVVRRAERMLEEGAGLLDLGAVSTRPGAPEVTQEAERQRLMPALEALVSRGLGPISVDTYRSGIARQALDRGALMINDVRAAREPGMVTLLAERKPWVCLMHMRGDPKTMQIQPIVYGDTVAQVGSWLSERVQVLVAEGLPQEHVVVDPGIGFGKDDPHNLALTLGLSRLEEDSGCPVLYGASRKSLIGRIAGVAEPQARLPGSLSLLGAACRAGARVVRVHDVAATKQFLALELALAQT